MFFFEAQPLTTWLVSLAVFLVLIGLSELGRRFKSGFLLIFIILPIVLTVAVWPHTTKGTSVNDWFHYAKIYSALTGVLIFWVIGHVKGASSKKWILFMAPAILIINICEAVARDFQVYGLHYNHQIFDGMMTVSGSWNVMNGIAGILNIITLTGFVGICVSKDKSKTMLWPDMLWFWILAYDLWNFAYTYNCIPDHSFYAGIPMLLAPTFAAFFIKKGAWLQHRAQTLTVWCMFAMTYPGFIDTSRFAVKSTHNAAPLFTASFLALIANIAVFGYYIYKIVKTKRNPITEELYTDLKSYKEIKELAE
ncbi:MAG: DUF5692 family protein [Clostridiaceae bacterium]